VKAVRTAPVRVVRAYPGLAAMSPMDAEPLAVLVVVLVVLVVVLLLVRAVAAAAPAIADESAPKPTPLAVRQCALVHRRVVHRRMARAPAATTASPSASTAHALPVLAVAEAASSHTVTKLSYRAFTASFHTVTKRSSRAFTASFHTVTKRSSRAFTRR